MLYFHIVYNRQVYTLINPVNQCIVKFYTGVDSQIVRVVFLVEIVVFCLSRPTLINSMRLQCQALTPVSRDLKCLQEAQFANSTGKPISTRHIPHKQVANVPCSLQINTDQDSVQEHNQYWTISINAKIHLFVRKTQITELNICKQYNKQLINIMIVVSFPTSCALITWFYHIVGCIPQVLFYHRRRRRRRRRNLYL